MVRVSSTPVRAATSKMADDGLMTWARSADIQSPKLIVADFDGLRGMAAAIDIAIDDKVVSLPKEMALLVTPRQKCPFPELCDPGFWSSAPWFLKMSLLLLAESRAGDASRLSGYVESLPQAFDTPFHWEPAELEALQVGVHAPFTLVAPQG
jgi:hypothetical protein